MDVVYRINKHMLLQTTGYGSAFLHFNAADQ